MEGLVSLTVIRPFFSYSKPSKILILSTKTDVNRGVPFFLGSLHLSPLPSTTTVDGPSRDSQDIWDRLNVLLGKYLSSLPPLGPP